MDYSKSTVGISGAQLANGTPSDKVFILKSFYKDDRAVISPAKDLNGRYLGINTNIPEIKKLEMGYVPSPESRIKLYDGMEINLNEGDWAKDWEWMKHCQEIAADYQTGQASPGAYFYIYRPGAESAKTVSETEDMVRLMNYVLQDSVENLFNRAKMLGVDMTGGAVSDVKAFLLSLATGEPARLRAVYESPTLTLELMLMHAIAKDVITNRSGMYTFGEVLLGVDDKAVISYFANPKNSATTRVIESLTYGTRPVAKNPLENEVRNDEDFEVSAGFAENVNVNEDTSFKASTLEAGDSIAPGFVSDVDKFVQDTIASQDTPGTAQPILTPQQRAALTRKNNQQK